MAVYKVVQRYKKNMDCGVCFGKIPLKKLKYRQNSIFIACKSQAISKIPIIPIIPPSVFKKSGRVVVYRVEVFECRILRYIWNISKTSNLEFYSIKNLLMTL